MTTDEELVARSRGGDLDSFNQLVVRWERPIYALAYRVIGREEEARDVAQETFLRAFRALGGFKGQAKFSSWLYRITLNLCRDWMRRERRTPVSQAPEGVDIIEMAGEGTPSESIEDLVGRHELGRAVGKAMALLPEEQRTAISLKEYHGLTFQEIADLLDCPLSTVKTRLYQGLSVLRKHLSDAGADEQPPPVDVVGQRTAVQAEEEQGQELHEAEGADREVGAGQPVDLVGQRDVGHHPAEVEHGAGEEEQPEVARRPQRRRVDAQAAQPLTPGHDRRSSQAGGRDATGFTRRGATRRAVRWRPPRCVRRHRAWPGCWRRAR